MGIIQKWEFVTERYTEMGIEQYIRNTDRAGTV